MRRYSPGWGGIEPDDDGDYVEYAEAAARIAALLDALFWCSAASDFQEGGMAREGWLKVCKPLIDRAALAPAPAPEAQVPYTEGEEHERFLQQLRKGEPAPTGEASAAGSSRPSSPE